MIREMKQSDLAMLRDIYFQTRLEAFYWLNPNEIGPDDFQRDTAGERVWVAVSKDQVVGFISVWEPENFIHHLYVLPRFTGRQIGSRLLACCLEHIGRPATLKCVSANTRALGFYQARGWRTLSTGTGPEGEYQLMQANET
jgi:GNAT superfamily N-acetyltransferase